MDDLVKLHMVDFDVILGMNWLHFCYVLVDYRIRLVKFEFPNETFVEWKSSSTAPKVSFISYLKVKG